jgi:hypothetical protein
MARPIPKAILSQTFESLRISGHFGDTSPDSMFDRAKKCPKMNSDSRLKIIPLESLGLGRLGLASNFGDISAKIPGIREKYRELFATSRQNL